MRFRNLTIGQHIPGNSVVHRLDPRTKILGTTLLIVLLFAVNGFIGYGLVALAIAGVIHLAKLPWRYVIRGLRPLLVILLLTVGLNVFLTEGK